MSRVFSSYSSKDGAAIANANALVAALEEPGQPCWIAPRNMTRARTIQTRSFAPSASAAVRWC